MVQLFVETLRVELGNVWRQVPLTGETPRYEKRHASFKGKMHQSEEGSSQLGRVYFLSWANQNIEYSVRIVLTFETASQPTSCRWRRKTINTGGWQAIGDEVVKTPRYRGWKGAYKKVKRTQTLRLQTGIPFFMLTCLMWKKYLYIQFSICTS